MIKKIVFVFLILSFWSSKAQDLDPLKDSNEFAQKKWVDSMFSTMTIDQKIGQLFMVQAYSNLDEKHSIGIDSLIEKYHIGGLIFMQGTPIKQAELTNRYQSKAKTPLLIGFDGEWGLDMRLKNTYRFPWNMTLGAIRNNKLIEDFGIQLGKHCKRLGIQMNFAPVVDVNTNPENPIIGNRSFGESRENVTEKSISFIKGMQSQKILSSAKHFPGHGDTSTDSHKTLPVLEYEFERLDSIELYPYKELIQNSLTSVMVAHLSVKALEPNSQLPTSLSYNVISNLLKKDLKFNGLILTDALNMKGAADYAEPGDIDLAALLAGNDILLISEDPPTGIAKIMNAYYEGKITEERLQYSVKKILKAKFKVGLNSYKPIPLENLVEDLNRIKDASLYEELIALGGKQFLCCGGAGVLVNKDLGCLVVPNEGVRDEGTSYHYVEASRTIKVNKNTLEKLKNIMSDMHLDYLVGKTWTTDAFYRETRQKINQRLYEGCLTVEMEFTALVAVAKFRKVEFAEILYCGDDLSQDVWDGREWNQQDLLRKDLIFLTKRVLKKM